MEQSNPADSSADSKYPNKRALDDVPVGYIARYLIRIILGPRNAVHENHPVVSSEKNDSNFWKKALLQSRYYFLVHREDFSFSNKVVISLLAQTNLIMHPMQAFLCQALYPWHIIQTR